MNMHNSNNQPLGNGNGTTGLNIFAGVRNAKTSERGAFLKPGQYKVQINRVVNKRTRKNYDAFIVEFNILESQYAKKKAEAVAALGDRAYDPATLELTLPSQAGASASWFQSLADIDIGFGSLKSFAAGLLGCRSEDQEFLEAVERFLSEAVNSNGLGGAIVPLEVIEIQTKKGGTFSLHKWGQDVTDTSLRLLEKVSQP